MAAKPHNIIASAPDATYVRAPSTRERFITLRTLRWSTASLSIAVSLASCLPPSAVGRFARSASETTAEFPAVAREMYASCLRFEAYSAQRSAAAWYDNESLRARCASRDTAVDGVLAANRILSAYLAALGKLADDKVISADPEIGRLATAAKKSGLNTGQVNAVGELAKYLTSMALDVYRRQKLEDAIASQNDNVILVTGGLRDVIDLDYRRSLAIETRAANDFYRTSIAEGRSREPLAAVLVLRDRDAQLEALGKRGEALDAYVKALDAVRTGHQKLYEHRNQLRARNVSAELLQNAETLDKIARQLEKAF